jgi:hypothetical protein
MATSQVAVNKDLVKEPSIQLLETTINASSKRLQDKLYISEVQKVPSNNSQTSRGILTSEK